MESDPTDVEAGVSQVLETLAQRPSRDEHGRYITGHAEGKTLERSDALWAALEPLKRELVQRTSTALAIDQATPETFLGLIDAYAEARLFRQAMFRRLAELGGPITSKGKARALYTAYLGAYKKAHPSLARQLKTAEEDLRNVAAPIELRYRRALEYFRIGRGKHGMTL